MKKVNLLATLLCLTLAGCGASKTPLAAKEGVSLHAAGAHSILVDGAWVANEWSATDNNKMSAVSLADIQKLDKELAKSLKEKELEYAYTLDIQLGVSEAGWTADCMKGGEKVSVDGSFTVKAIQASYDSEDKTYVADQWISDPHTAHAESLTPDTLFMPRWTEEADENGFAWNSNPVCIGEAGTYTFLLVKYTAVSAANTAGYGMGLFAK